MLGKYADALHGSNNLRQYINEKRMFGLDEKKVEITARPSLNEFEYSFILQYG